MLSWTTTESVASISLGYGFIQNDGNNDADPLGLVGGALSGGPFTAAQVEGAMLGMWDPTGHRLIARTWLTGKLVRKLSCCEVHVYDNIVAGAQSVDGDDLVSFAFAQSTENANEHAMATPYQKAATIAGRMPALERIGAQKSFSSQGPWCGL